MDGNYEFIDKDWIHISPAGKDFVSWLVCKYIQYTTNI